MQTIQRTGSKHHRQIKPRTHKSRKSMLLALADNDAAELIDRVIRICTLPRGFDRNALQVSV